MSAAMRTDFDPATLRDWPKVVEELTARARVLGCCASSIRTHRRRPSARAENWARSGILPPASAVERIAVILLV